MNKRLKYTIILTAVAITGIMACWQMERDRSVVTYNKDNLIRFHVIANSNSAEDQALKYQVRDVIVNSMAERFKGVQDVAGAREIVQESLQDISNLAVDCIRSKGYDYPVTVSLGDYEFPTKSYNLDKTELEGETARLTLPEDTYEAVRVVIGEGNGANWWCILFPPLCFVDFGKTEVNTGAPESVSAPDAPELKQSGGLVKNEVPEEQTGEKNGVETREEQQKSDKENEDAAVKAFKLNLPGEVRVEGVNNNADSGSIQLRFRCVEIYDHARTWFSQAFGTGRA